MRSGGVSFSAALRSAKRFVPAAVCSPGIRGRDPFDGEVRDFAELGFEITADRGRLLGAVGECLAGTFIEHDDGDVGEALALLLRSVGLGRAAISAARAARRSSAPRERRASSTMTSPNAKTASTAAQAAASVAQSRSTSS